MRRVGPNQLAPKQSRLRRVLRGLGITLAALIAIIGALVAWLHSDSGQRFVTERVRAALAERIDGKVELSSVEAKLFGVIAVKKLVLSDPAGKPVVELDELVVRPSWRDLVRGKIVIDEIVLDGVRLDLEQYADGSSNLKRMIKPRPSKPSEPSAKKRHRIVVRSIGVRHVGLKLQKPDGSKLALSEVGLDASVDAIPDDQTLSLAIHDLGASLERSSADGTRIVVKDLKTGVEARLVDGAGSAKLLPLSAELRLERAGRQPFTTPIALGGLELEIKPGELGAMLGKLEAGLVVLESLEVRAAHANEELHGPQRATLIGLSLQPERLNALLGKPLVREKVELAAKLAGPPEALRVALTTESAKARIALDGTVDITRPDRPRYDLELVTTGVDTKQLLAGPSVPEVAIERVVVGLKGEGIKRDQIATDIRVDVRNARVRGVAIAGVKLRGRFEHGVLTIYELTIDGLDQKLRATGTYVVATKEIDAKLTLSGDVGRALVALRRAGIPVKSQIPIGGVRFEPGELTLAAKGRIGERIDVTVDKGKLRVAGGAATVDAKLALDHGKLDTIDADLRLAKMDLGTLASFRGRKLRGVSGTLDGRISVHGTKQAPRIDANLRLDARSDRAPASVHVDLRAKGDRGNQHVSVVAERVREGERDRLLELDANLPLRLDGRPRLARGRPLSVKLSVPKRRFKELEEILPADVRAKLPWLPPDSELAAAIEIGGTTDAPRGSWHVSGNASLLADEQNTRQAVELGGTIEPVGNQSHASTKLELWLDKTKSPAVRANLDADFAHSPLVPGALDELGWKLRLDLSEQQLEKIPLIAERRISGRLAAHAELAGNRRDVRGRVDLDLKDFRREDLGPIALALRADMKDDHTGIDLKLRAADFEAATGHGRIGVAGKDLLAKLREKKLGDPSLDFDLDLERRRLADWGRLRPKLAELRGFVGGKIHVAGSAKQPLAHALLRADGFAMHGGKPGRADVELSANEQAIDVLVGLGPVREKPVVSLTATASRADLIELLRSKKGKRTADVTLSARADTTLAEALPDLTEKLAALRASGDLDWNMDGKLSLESSDGKRSLADGVITGTLGVTHGKVSIPDSKRLYRDVELRLSSSRDALSIERLSLRESDRENSARRLHASGKLVWNKLVPQRAILSLDADEWLLFGGDLLGKPDAPRAALTAKIDVNGAVGGRSRAIDVLVKKLNLRMPDRFDKAHWPEQISTGDVIYLDQPGAARGRLPIPTTAAKREPLPPLDPTKPSTVIHVEIPNRIHVQKPPFDMIASGKLDVRLVAGEKRPRITGELRVFDGGMDLGGRKHLIDKTKKSRIYFDDAHPAGELDLNVAYVPNPVALRDVSQASAGGSNSRIHLSGPISKPISTVNGVGNADLWDMLPVYNAGRVKFTTQPDMPASSSPQLPREYDVVLLSYMAANLPHNLFLDRLSAWSDPYDDRTAYGKVRHLEAERYSADGKTRIRVNARPPTIGQSDAEVEAGYLLLNKPRVKAGVGAALGSRAGGGPVLFFDWSSED